MDLSVFAIISLEMNLVMQTFLRRALFTCNVCFCVKLPIGWVLTQQVIVFTLDFYIFKNRTAKIKEKLQTQTLRVNLPKVTGFSDLTDIYTT